jgi:hypothetical protein
MRVKYGLLSKAFQLFPVSFLAFAFLHFLSLPDRVEKHDLVLLESAELIR